MQIHKYPALADYNLRLQQILIDVQLGVQIVFDLAIRCACQITNNCWVYVVGCAMLSIAVLLSFLTFWSNCSFQITVFS